MPVFEYRALTSGGKAVVGLREADSPKTLRSTLRREGVFLTEVLGDVKQRVNEGSTLADALGAHPRVFGDLFVNMIRAGEHSGALEIVLVRLAEFTESQARLRSKIMGTMAYPAAMMVIGSIVLGILFTVVIPRVTKIFADTKATLPWMTRGLIGFTWFVTQFWWALILIIAASIWGFLRWRATPAGKARWHRFVLTVPVFGRLVRTVAVGERSGALEEMLANVASAYEDQVDTTVAALTSLLEPLMIVVRGGVVAFIVFSVLMPILQINSLAGG